MSSVGGGEEGMELGEGEVYGAVIGIRHCRSDTCLKNISHLMTGRTRQCRCCTLELLNAVAMHCPSPQSYGYAIVKRIDGKYSNVTLFACTDVNREVCAVVIHLPAIMCFIMTTVRLAEMLLC